jgi:hypothetical protein
MAGRGGIGGIAGVICDCGPTPGGRAGIFDPAPNGAGIAGIGGAPGADCGPVPGGKLPGGIGPAPNGAGIPGKPGAAAVATSVAGFTCTKLRLFGKSSVSVPELRSRMSTGFGQPARELSELVTVISTRNEFVPAVYSKTLVSLP